MYTPCPCGSDAPFAECCQPHIERMKIAPTAEKLMRSRFTAFCRGAVEYLVETHHPSAHSANERAATQQSIAGTEWLHLTIVETSKGRENDTEGHVQFAAAYRKKPLPTLSTTPDTKTEVGQMHERSFFIRENDRWFYVDGDQLPLYKTPRNAPCWCGSGKKTKQCHF